MCHYLVNLFNQYWYSKCMSDGHWSVKLSMGNCVGQEHWQEVLLATEDLQIEMKEPKQWLDKSTSHDVIRNRLDEGFVIAKRPVTSRLGLR